MVLGTPHCEFIFITTSQLKFCYWTVSQFLRLIRNRCFPKGQDPSVEKHCIRHSQMTFGLCNGTLAVSLFANCSFVNSNYQLLNQGWGLRSQTKFRNTALLCFACYRILFKYLILYAFVYECSYVSIESCMRVPVCTHAHMEAGAQPQVPSVSRGPSSVSFETRSPIGLELTTKVSHSQDPPVSTFPTLASEACENTSGFLYGCRITISVRQSLHWLRPLTNLTHFVFQTSRLQLVTVTEACSPHTWKTEAVWPPWD